MTINQMKGFVAEEIARYHMQKIEYKVVPIGREKIEPELSDLLLFIRGSMSHLSKPSSESFSIFESVISKLPDYAVWKNTTNTGKNVMTFRFLEVKYRDTVAKLKKHPTEDKYSLNIEEKTDYSELGIHKYIKNLKNLYKISSDDNKIDNLDFYIYLITKIDGQHVPLIGKIQESKYSDYYTYLYTPEQLVSNQGLKNLWSNDYSTISDFFMRNNNLDRYFSHDFLIPLLGKTNEEISSIVLESLDSEF